MTRWLVHRTLQALVTWIAAAVVLFALMRLAPGDPLSRLAMERQFTAEEVAALRARYGLDRPLLEQFSAWAGGVLRGDFGVSIAYGRPVGTMIVERLPATLLLGGTVLLLNFTIGVWLGVQQALHRGTVPERVLALASLAAYATPSFWLGLVLAWLIGVRWQLLPVAGLTDPLLDPAAGFWVRAGDVLEHLILPALTLFAVNVARPMGYQRRAMLEAIHLPYVAAARARGLGERAVRWRHAWRSALFPIVTDLGLSLPTLVTGSVFVEYVFAWPGLGSLAAEAVGARDYPLLMGTALLVSSAVILGSVLADIAYAVLNPKVRWA